MPVPEFSENTLHLVDLGSPSPRSSGNLGFILEWRFFSSLFNISFLSLSYSVHNHVLDIFFPAVAANQQAGS